ncbi:chorismate lyase [Pleionea sp. CnH1-48]|uniref:chorismate--pyruvate lyase family protein n=1 Tax=Pleionea sp. CnH1-48 TaxID=2954494 RepID=UPI0020980A18|nr:chorismate lyase [Pleionea sp. CnH1-48]MCO7224532.1 chorismate lyase [Pleionea sp. CnH1-48]
MSRHDWLTEPGSLTALMEHECGAPIQVKLCRQRMASVQRREREWLDLPAREWALIREVELMNPAGHRWVWARTVVPLSTLKGAAGRLRLLKEQPLGPTLFNRLNAVRVAMNLEVTQYNPVKQEEANQRLWQRRSLFNMPSGQLLVSEIFLPDNPVYE